MRGISLDAKHPHILVLESSLDLMLDGTQYLSTPRRNARAAATRAQCSSQCAFTMRGISPDAKHHHIVELPWSSDLMLKCTRNLSARRPTRAVVTLARFAIRCAFTMRGISIDAKRLHIWGPESSLDLMPNGTQYLSAPRRIARTAATLARVTSRCAFTMRGISLDANCPHLVVPGLNSDLMLNGTRNLSALCRPTPAIATLV